MMIQERKIRSLFFVIAFLIVTNIVLLSFLIFSRNGGHTPSAGDLNTVGSFLKDSLGFDKDQMDRYQNLRKTDAEKGKTAFDGIRAAKNQFYENIYKDAVADSTIQQLANVIGEKQRAVDIHMLQHFKNLRAICNPKQLPRFDSLFRTIVEKVTLGKLRKHDKH